MTSELQEAPTPIPELGVRQGGQQTAKRAIAILLEANCGFYEPTKEERRALLVAFAARGKVIYGAAFDLLRHVEKGDFANAQSLDARLDHISVYEIKSTSKASVGPDLQGYFFALTTAELLVAQSLGSQYKFAFVNTLTGKHLELKLSDVFARARGIYPTWSIRF